MNTIINLKYELFYNGWNTDYVKYEVTDCKKEVCIDFLRNSTIKARLKSDKGEIIFTLDFRTFSIQENDKFYEWAYNNLKEYFRNDLKKELLQCFEDNVKNYVSSLSTETQCSEIYFIYALAKTNKYFPDLKSLFYEDTRSFIVLMDILEMGIHNYKSINLNVLYNYLIFSEFSKSSKDKVKIINGVFMNFIKLEVTKSHRDKSVELLIIKDNIQLSNLVHKGNILYQSGDIALVPNGNVTPTDYIIQCTITDKESKPLFRFNYTPFIIE